MLLLFSFIQNLTDMVIRVFKGLMNWLPPVTVAMKFQLNQNYLFVLLQNLVP